MRDLRIDLNYEEERIKTLTFTKKNIRINKINN